MGRHATGDRKYEIEKIWDRHREMIRLILVGMDNVEIAAQLNVTPQNVSDVRNSAIVREKLELMQMERDKDAVSISKRISSLAPKALSVLDDILEGAIVSTSGDKIRAATDLLDRGGFAPAQRHHHAHAVLTGQELLDIKARASKAGIVTDNNGVDEGEEYEDAEILEAV